MLKSFYIKQFILFALMTICCANKMNAQADSIAKNDSANRKDTVCVKISDPIRIGQKQPGTQVYSFYKPLSHEDNYRMYRSTQANYNATRTTIISIAGNLLFSLFADKTNHVYQPNYNH